MKLIGLLDSPYVRRVAISMQLLGMRFEHESISVFRTFAQFRSINPVVKAPTFICDDGEVLMDSTLILQYLEAMARPRTLMPAALPDLQHALRILGLALAACEKSIQILYEHEQRPPDKLHPAWVERATGQMLAAWGALEQELGRRPLAAGRNTIDQAGVTIAVAWHFTQQTVPELVPAARYPALVAFSAQAEALPEFLAAPHGDSVCVPVSPA